MGQPQHGPGGVRALHRGRDPLQGFSGGQAFRQQLAEAVVATEGTGGGGQQVTQTGQTIKTAGLAPQAAHHIAHFRQATTEQGGPRIGAQAEAIANASRHGHHVLEGPGHLGAEGIGIGVEPQPIAAQRLLQTAGEGQMAGGQHAGCRQSMVEFTGEIGTAEHQQGGGGNEPTPEHRRRAEALGIQTLGAAEQWKLRGPVTDEAIDQGLHPQHRNRRDDQILIGKQGRGITAITTTPGLEMVALLGEQPGEGETPGTLTEDGDAKSHAGRME